MKILVIGATGFVGTRLVPRLIERGHDVRTGPPRLDEAGSGDLPSLLSATDGVGVVYYLAPSLDGDSFSFDAHHRAAARNLTEAAERNGVRRIIFLSGLADDAGNASAQLRSRHEVGELLRSGLTPVTEFRSGLIVGDGAPSFVMLRQLVERLPLMLMPRWVATRTQPIALDDVVRYLALSLEDAARGNVTYDIGGPEIMTYRSMMERYARWLGRRRIMVQLPVVTPRWSAYWVDLVTSLPDSSARPLIEGLREATVLRDDAAIRAFGPPEIGFEEALRRATDGASTQQDARPRRIVRLYTQLAGFLSRRLYPDVLLDERVRTIPADTRSVWHSAIAIGGRRGYPMLDWLWRIRGALDRAMGGPGLNRRGPSAEEVAVGDQLDFWRIIELDTGRRLLLRALMKAPGEAELELAVRGNGHATVFVQTARFRPAGLLGRMYWWSLYPIHWMIFRGMADRVVRVATPEGSTSA